MATIKPFKGIRPVQELAAKIASRPYDVINSKEAKELAQGNEYSLLHIIKPEIDFEDGVNVYDQKVYDKAVENYEAFQKKGWLVQDDEEYLYIYSQTMNGKTQYGLVACASVEEYMNGLIKKHELTRPDKEEDRMKHVRNAKANIEPVFFTYPEVKEIDTIVGQVVAQEKPVYDFVADDGVGHTIWVIKNKEQIENLVELFKSVPATYIADGHHRTAAAALVGIEMKKNNPNHTGDEEYNYFLAVHFPGDQLQIIDYNRVVKDLNGLSKEGFLERVAVNFTVEKQGATIYKPEKLHVFSIYIDGEWYKLTANDGTFDDSDPIGVLDVTILSKYILEPILGIEDLRRDKRIDFVGGIRGLGELKKRVDSGDMKIAFALYPVTMEQLFNIADSGEIMPPKTTWFEPKLRSGLIIHSLTEE